MLPLVCRATHRCVCAPFYHCYASYFTGLCVCVSVAHCVLWSVLRFFPHWLTWDCYCHTSPCVFVSFCLSIKYTIHSLISVTVLYFCFHSASTTTFSDIVGGSHTYMCRACWIFVLLKTKFSNVFRASWIVFRSIFVGVLKPAHNLTEINKKRAAIESLQFLVWLWMCNELFARSNCEIRFRLTSNRLKNAWKRDNETQSHQKTCDTDLMRFWLFGWEKNRGFWIISLSLQQS